MRKRIIGTVAGAILALGTVLGLGPATAANAQSGYQICDISFTCLNAWNGGPYVNTYSPAVSNDNFELQPIYDRCETGSDLTTPNCPYSGVPGGFLIVQIEYLNDPGNCLGDFNGLSTDARAGAFDTCNNPSSGYGGSYGTVFFEYNAVVDGQATCPPGHFQLYSFHWQYAGLNYPGAGNDEPWYLNTYPLDCLEQSVL
jgi:hypothetical protein